MSRLAQARKPQLQPPIITIVSEPGYGKTSLAASFPNPIILQVESVDSAFQDWNDDDKPDLLPMIDSPNKQRGVSSFDQVKESILALYQEEHDYQTLIVDSITAMNTMFEKEIAQNDGVDTVANAAGGFHKGYGVLKGYHDNVMNMCQKLSKHRNMTIIFLGHMGTEKRKNDPSELSEYTVNSIDMHADSTKIYTNNSDAVIYINIPKNVVGAKTDKKGVQTATGRVLEGNSRQLITSAEGMMGYGYAKNRFNMPALLDFEKGSNPLMQYIRFFNTTNNTTQEEEV